MADTADSTVSYSRSRVNRRSIGFWAIFFLATSIAGPLAFGGIIYLAFRTQALVMFSWIERIGLGSCVTQIRWICSPLILELPTWVVFSLPNALWVYSFSCTIGLLWHESGKIPFGCIFFLAPFLGIGSELGQSLGVIDGTFCCGDIIAYLAGSLVALAFMYLFRKVKDEK